MLAPFGLAEIVRVFPVSPLRPAGFHRHAAAIAGHEPTQRKVMADVMPCRNLGAAMQLILNPAEGFKRDNWLVMPLGQPDIPFRVVKIAGVKFPVQHIQHALHMHFALPVFWKNRLLRQKVFHFNRRAEAVGGKTLHRFLYNRSQRLIPHQHFAMRAALLHFVSAWWAENPIPTHHPRTHPVLNLLGVFLTLVLRHAGQQVLDKLAV